MSPIDPPKAQVTGSLKPRTGSAPLPEARTQSVRPKTDAIAISLDARVKLDEKNKPVMVLEHIEVDGVEQVAAAQVASNMKGRRAGVKEQVTKQVMAAIAEAVAKSLEPVLQAKLAEALTAEHLPASLSIELAHQAIPEIAKVIAAQLADKVKITTTLGR